MTAEEKEATLAKLRAQKRATVGGAGAALARSKSVNTVPAGGAAEDKRAALKKRLESFNKISSAVEGEASAADEPEVAAAVEPKKARAPLKKATTEQVLPSSKRGDALLDGDSSGDEAPAKASAQSSGRAKEEPLCVGEKLEAIYLEDGLWYAAKVEEVYDDGSCTVVFTEYGNTQVCQPSELKRRAKKTDDKAQRLEKIKNRQQSAKEELAKQAAEEPEEQPADDKRWRGQSAIGVAPPEIAGAGKSKRDREKAHRGTFSQMGNDSVATPDAGLFAEDSAVVLEARRKARETQSDAGDEELSGDENNEEPVEEEPEEEEEEKESPTFLAKLFGGGSSKKEKEKEKTPPPKEKEKDKTPAPKEKGFFAKMFGSSSDDEESKKPAKQPTPRSNKKEDKSGFFDDLFKKGDKEDSEDDDEDEDVSAFFGKKK